LPYVAFQTTEVLLDNRLSIPGNGRDIYLRKHVQTGSGNHPASHQRDISSGAKLYELDVDHSPQSSGEMTCISIVTYTCSFRGG